MDSIVETPPSYRRRWLYRAMIFLGPVGLFAVISLAMWVANWQVGPAIVVHVEPSWRPGTELAVRVQLLDSENQKMKMNSVELFVQEQEKDELTSLIELKMVNAGLAAQGVFVVPPLVKGPTTITAKVIVGASPVELQRFSVTVSDELAKNTAARIQYPSETALMRADDSDAQPNDYFFDLRADGRLLAGLKNKLWLRIGDRQGKPIQGEVEVVLVQGEFIPEVKASSNPELLFRGELDALGLAVIQGQLLSEVIRVDLRLHQERLGNSKSIITRKVRLVSRTGATKIRMPRRIYAKGQTVAIAADSLQPNGRPIYLDFYDEQGVWVNTLSPTLSPNGKWRNWIVPENISSSIVKVEAYPALRMLTEIVDVQHFWIRNSPENTGTSVLEIVDYVQKILDSPDTPDRGEIAKQVDRHYLKYLRAAKLSSSDQERAKDWMLGTLPNGVFVPPSPKISQKSAEEKLSQKRATWIAGLRLVLYGGGGFLIVGLAILSWMEARELARSTAQVLAEGSPDEGHQGISMDWGITLRSLVILLGMVIALVLVGVVLDSFVWGQSENWR